MINLYPVVTYAARSSERVLSVIDNPCREMEIVTSHVANLVQSVSKSIASFSTTTASGSDDWLFISDANPCLIDVRKAVAIAVPIGFALGVIATCLYQKAKASPRRNKSLEILNKVPVLQSQCTQQIRYLSIR